MFSHYRPLESLLQNAEHLFQHLSTLSSRFILVDIGSLGNFQKCLQQHCLLVGLLIVEEAQEEHCFWRCYRLLWHKVAHDNTCVLNRQPPPLSQRGRRFLI